MRNRKPTAWYLCISFALLLVIITFTPLVIPHGKYNPILLGMPYTIWTGILISLGLVIITFISVFVHPGSDKKD
ncbi:MAG: hypothetical protein AMS27_11080 [Bacteroides sp. SM23_62_1]|nr:MAG: hypothetical protein AMS27_11080 [Bacteroides sp. SM23_62_1]